ncbi:MAG: Crp/Fnr family transcriptional regulator [Planctomycetaceae bacterium]|nr:Crp/Fnr family transcriptional regulator [Planctomycetaceae bacterium]
MAERLWSIQKSPLFEKLTTDELGELERHARQRKFPRNSTIYLPDDAADWVYVVVEGRVRLISITSDGKQAILGFFEPGDLFGELAVAGIDRHDHFAEAALNSTIVSIPSSILSDVMERNGALSLAITRLIGWRRQRLERRLRNLLFHSNRERLLALLYDLMQQYGRPSDGGVLIDIRLSHQDLASLIGVTRESVTLLLGEFQSEGLLKTGRQKVVILSPDRLARAAGEKPPEHSKPPLKESIHLSRGSAIEKTSPRRG